VTSNAKLQQSKWLKTPLDAQKHGLIHSKIGRSYSKKRHRDGKKGRSGGNSFIESSSRNSTSDKLSNNDTGLSVPRKKKKRHSLSSLTEYFKKANPPTFDGEIKKGE